MSNSNLEFIGSPNDKERAIKSVDSALKRFGDFGQYGNLSDGLNPVLNDYKVRIIDNRQAYSVSISPACKCGHDFAMRVDKLTFRISELIVGEVLPPSDN